MVQLASITSIHWQPRINSDAVAEALEDVAQAIQIIIGTPLGSEPLRPNFGCGLYKYIDQPIDRARAHIVREVWAAISQWEPRAKLVRVWVDLVGESHAKLRIRWQLANAVAGDFQETTVNV